MKNIISTIRLSLVCLLLFAGAYPLAIYGIAQFAPNHGRGQVLTQQGKVVGYALIGQPFDKPGYFWGRPSAVAYNAAGSGGSNKAPGNAEYLALVQKRIDTLLIAHPYLKKSDIPADLVTASGSGLDPDISVQGAMVQVRRVAADRKMEESKVRELVAKQIEKTAFGPEKINVLKLNLALDALTSSQKNVN